MGEFRVGFARMLSFTCGSGILRLRVACGVLGSPLIPAQAGIGSIRRQKQTSTSGPHVRSQRANGGWLEVGELGEGVIRAGRRYAITGPVQPFTGKVMKIVEVAPFRLILARGP